MRAAFVNRSLLTLAILCGIGSGRELAHAGHTQSFAIMGEISRPGVFELNDVHPQLLDLVKQAGGPTTTASGNVRIIRGGRPGEQTFLVSGSNYPLNANDLVILDSWQSRSKRQDNSFWPDEMVDRASKGGEALPADSMVQLGLVNLISRPVILDVTHEEATLGTVLTLLHQPGRDIRVVTILKPAGGFESVACDHTADVCLASGSVLVFDPTTVDAAVLPQLPATVRLSTKVDSPSAMPHPPQESIPQALTRLRAATNAPARLPIRPDIAIGELPASRRTTKKLDHPSPPDHLAQADRVPAQASAGFPATGLLVLVGAIGVSTIVLSRLRTRRQREPVAPEAALPAAEGTKALKALISNSLPVFEEALPLSRESEIFGRPRLDSPYRVDVAHALSGPHYAVEPVQSVPAPSRAGVEVNLRRPADDRPAKNIRVDRAHPRSSLGALDRALATFEEGRS